MAKILTSSTADDCITARDLGARILGYPAAGTNYGQGVHNVDLSTPPAFGATKPGWTAFHVDVVSIGGASFEIDLTDFEAEIPIDAGRPQGEQRLTGQQRAALAVLIGQAVEMGGPAPGNAVELGRDTTDGVKGRT